MANRDSTNRQPHLGPGHSRPKAQQISARFRWLLTNLDSSEAEYILPLKLDVLLPAFLASRTVSVVAGEFARAVGRYANPALGLLRRKPSTLVVEPCRDWEKLAALFHRHRPAEWTTTDRSPAFLRWRYGQNAANRRFEIFVFRDTLGNEGWFALGTITRGRGGVIRGRIVLDLVWPREKLGFGEICPAILRVGEAGADAIYFKPRRDLDYRECGRWLVRRRSPVPAGFAIPRKGCTAISVSSLDLVEADGDGAF